MKPTISRRILAVFLGVPAVLTYLTGVFDPLSALGIDSLALRVASVSGILAVLSGWQLWLRHESVEALIAANRQPLDKVRPSSIGVSVSSLAETAVGSEKAPYVDRNNDKKLAAALKDERIIVVTGPSGSGKSRSAWQQMLRVDPGLKLLVPKKPPADGPLHPLAELLALAPRRLPGNKAMCLWLDDFGEHLARDNIDLNDLQRWVDVSDRRRIIVTISSEIYAAFKRDPGPKGNVARELDKHAFIHSMSLDWSGEELKQGRKLYPTAANNARQLARYLSHGKRQLTTFHDARGACPEAYAVLLAAVDWRRARFARSAPRGWLRSVFPIYLERPVPEAELDACFARGLEWATQRVDTFEPVLTGTRDGGFLVGDVVLEFVESQRLEIPEETWRTLLDSAHGAADLVAFADAARAAEQIDLALDALQAVSDDEAMPLAVRQSAGEAWAALRQPEKQTAAAALGSPASSDVTAMLVVSPPPPDEPVQVDAKPRRWLRFLFAHRGLLAMLRLALLVAADVLAVWLALFGAALMTQVAVPPDLGAAREVTDDRIGFVGLIVVVLFLSAGLYRAQRRRGSLARPLTVLAQASLLFFALRLVAGERVGSWAVIVWASIFGFASVFVLRWWFANVAHWAALRARGRKERVALIGAAEAVLMFRKLLVGDPKRRELVGWIAASPTSARADDLPSLGVAADLADIIRHYKLDEVVLCDEGVSEVSATEMAAAAWRTDAKLRAVADGRHFLAPVSHYLPGEPLPLDELRVPVFDSARTVIKRGFDLVVASLCLLAVSIPWILIAAAIKATSRGPVLHVSVRPGYNGELFDLLKFRVRVRGSQRFTFVGKVLDRLGLDEIPQLVNVLRGQMSLVGPRPVIVSQFDRLSPWQKRRYLVLPGITGLWQISGRHDTDFSGMARLDLYYVQRWSLFLDVEILMKTAIVSLTGKRASLKVDSRGRYDPTRTDRRAPFGDHVLAALRASPPMTFTEVVAVAGDGCDQHDALRWLAKVDAKSWLDVEGGRFRLSERGLTHLATDPRVVGHSQL